MPDAEEGGLRFTEDDHALTVRLPARRIRATLIVGLLAVAVFGLVIGSGLNFDGTIRKRPVSPVKLAAFLGLGATAVFVQAALAAIPWRVDRKEDVVRKVRRIARAGDVAAVRLVRIGSIPFLRVRPHERILLRLRNGRETILGEFPVTNDQDRSPSAEALARRVGAFLGVGVQIVRY